MAAYLGSMFGCGLLKGQGRFQFQLRVFRNGQCACERSTLTRLLLSLPPLLSQPVLLPDGSTLVVSRNDPAVKRTLKDTHTHTHTPAHTVWQTEGLRHASSVALCLSCYLDAVLSLTQASIAQWSSAVMADRNESSREGNVSALALCQELLVLHLHISLSMKPELMLRGRPAQERMKQNKKSFYTAC